MKSLLFLLQLQLLRLSIASSSKLKYRMDVIVAATFVGKANETALKQALLIFPETFQFDQDHTRMALLVYDHKITRITSLTDDHDTVVKRIKDLKNRPDEERSLLHKALAEMLEISNTTGRTNALKLFIVLTHKCPTKSDEEAISDYTEALPVSENLKSNGLLFIVFDGADSAQKVQKYFRKLCGAENLDIDQGFRNTRQIFQSKLFPKIDVGVCERRERFCSFVDATLVACKTVWHYPYLITPNTSCPNTNRNRSVSNECDIVECFQNCHRYLPWQSETNMCDCDIVTGQDDAQFQLLSHCPRFRKCKLCKVQQAMSDDDSTTTTSPTFNRGLAMWAVIAIAIVVSTALVVIAATMIVINRNVSSSTTTDRATNARTATNLRNRPSNRSIFSAKGSSATCSRKKKTPLLSVTSR